MNLDLENSKWSSWYSLDARVETTNVPDKPGIYEVKTDIIFGRLKGESSVVTIGSSGTSLRKRLCEQRIRNSVRYLNRAEKWLVQAKHSLEFRYVTTANREEARYLEVLRLLEYENEHWELPPGNDRLELSPLKKQIEQVCGVSVEQMVQDLLQGKRLSDQAADMLNVSPAIIDNLVVYFGRHMIHNAFQSNK